MRRHYSLLYAILISSASARFEKVVLSKRDFTSPSSAWNGQITPGSDTTQQDGVPFTPYWVPFGSASVDDSDSRIEYSPATAWRTVQGHDYIGSAERQTDTPKAEARYTFEGSGIEWYGSMSGSHGMAEVWVDGSKKEVVDLCAQTTRTQQLLFHTDGLLYGSHTIAIIALGRHNAQAVGSTVGIDSFVVQQLKPASSQEKREEASLSPKRMQKVVRRASQDDNSPGSAEWKLAQTGTSGIAAMQLAVVDDKHALIVDKVEHNLLSVKGHPAWGAVYDFTTSQVRPLDMKSNSFCAGGTFLGNGTLINVGGNPVTSDHTGSADFGDVNGLQAIRMFDPCDGDDCDIFEDAKRMRMAGPRWYSSVARLSDGSAFIMGGAIKGGWQNNKTANNPTIEYYPPKNIHGSNGLPIASPFLIETLNANLFPILFQLPNDKIFVAANRQAMLYDWKSNTEQRLPDIPNGVRVTYPMSAGAVMLPLTPENGYTPEILICGGSTVSDTEASYDLSSQRPASDQCVRMVLDENGIKTGWQVEHMPEARLMPDLVLMPDGNVLIVNGAGTGVAGYGNVKNQAGQSNADNPVYRPVLYKPGAPAGKRFSSAGMPTSDIARLYHSVATLLPSGEVLIAGSNPNLDRTIAAFPTEYRVETLSPPYTQQERPAYIELPSNHNYGEVFKLPVTLPADTQLGDISVSLVDLGFVTHAVHMNSRLVSLTANALSDGGRILEIAGPPSPQIYPPGPGWLYILVKGIPSEGKKVMVGDGSGPPVDGAAIDNVLRSTTTLAKDPKSR